MPRRVRLRLLSLLLLLPRPHQLLRYLLALLQLLLLLAEPWPACRCQLLQN